ncbi:hypothetical protein BDZ91DRAFT_752453 [Kalaharituber pfeilii]|nr:hypothetical protein BDZ91DRAFT_752453 [Kalaharituber pfeilii]
MHPFLFFDFCRLLKLVCSRCKPRGYMMTALGCNTNCYQIAGSFPHRPHYQTQAHQNQQQREARDVSEAERQPATGVFREGHSVDRSPVGDPSHRGTRRATGPGAVEKEPHRKREKIIRRDEPISQTFDTQPTEGRVLRDTLRGSIQEEHFRQLEAAGARLFEGGGSSYEAPGSTVDRRAKAPPPPPPSTPTIPPKAPDRAAVAAARHVTTSTTITAQTRGYASPIEEDEERSEPVSIKNGDRGDESGRERSGRSRVQTTGNNVVQDRKAMRESMTTSVDDADIRYATAPSRILEHVSDSGYLRSYT